MAVRRSHLLVRVPVNAAALGLSRMADGLGLVAMGRVVELIDHVLLRAAATWV